MIPMTLLRFTNLLEWLMELRTELHLLFLGSYKGYTEEQQMEIYIGRGMGRVSELPCPLWVLCPPSTLMFTRLEALQTLSHCLGYFMEVSIK